ncbi:hypothetical protein EVAR_74659_1 [Eumeta japonica]|uniref:Uncharacterized protein n=1 Tax=Eumeta variegata TaxID=151549 RepID=A0A4C1WDA5_EUMVA|nr:hypothetical protein EVAR_74659_1 [Eumeta japonica]
MKTEPFGICPSIRPSLSAGIFSATYQADPARRTSPTALTNEVTTEVDGEASTLKLNTRSAFCLWRFRFDSKITLLTSRPLYSSQGDAARGLGCGNTTNGRARGALQWPVCVVPSRQPSSRAADGLLNNLLSKPVMQYCA